MKRSDILDRYKESHEDELENQALTKGAMYAFYVQCFVCIIIMITCLILWKPTILYGMSTMFWIHLTAMNFGRYQITKANKYAYQCLAWVLLALIFFVLFSLSVTGVIAI